MPKSMSNYSNFYSKPLNLTWHANTPISTSLIDTRSIVHAWTGLALVEVDFASGSSEAGETIAAIRTGGVDADAVVFARGT